MLFLVSIMCMLVDVVQLRPLSPNDLTRCDQILGLSTAQRQAATYYFEHYSDKCADLFNRIPHVPPGHSSEHEVYRQQLAAIAPLDDGLFESISKLCTPEQQQWIVLVRLARERQRYVAAIDFSRETGRPFVFLDEVLLSSSVIDNRAIRDQLMVYAQESTLRLRALQEECYDLFDRRSERTDTIDNISMEQRKAIGEEEGAESLRMANGIDDLNIQWALMFARALPSDQAADVIVQFGSAQYHEAERYWILVRVLRELLGSHTVLPPDAEEFRTGVDALLRAGVVDDFPALIAKVRADMPRIYPYLGSWPDGSGVLAYTRQIAGSLGDGLRTLCEAEVDGRTRDELMEFWVWAARRAQNESPLFDSKGQLLIVRQPTESFSAEELRAITGKISIDEATREVIDFIIEDYEQSTEELRRSGETTRDAYVSLSRKCIEDIRQVLPRGRGEQLLQAATECLDRASFFNQSKAHGLAGLDVARLALTSEALTARVLANHLSNFHSTVLPLLEARAEEDPTVEDLVRWRKRGTANAQIAEVSYGLLNTLTDGKPGLIAERQRLLRIMMPSLYFERDSIAALYQRRRDAEQSTVQRETLENAWVDYIAKDDLLLRDLLSLASQAHSWGRGSDGMMTPQIPTETGDLIAKAKRLTERRSELGAMIERTLTLDE